MSDNDSLVGFIGLHGNMIEMLFIDSEARGHGYGSALIAFAFEKGATRVDVNEQNPSALAFTRQKGSKSSAEMQPTMPVGLSRYSI